MGGTLKIGGRVTQTSGVAIYHVKDKYISVLLMYCMMQWNKHYFITNYQNRRQNKLVDMVNGNNLIIRHIYIYDLCFF